MTTSYTDGGCGPVTKVRVRIAQAIGEVMFNTGLIFCAGVPIAVLPWERSPHGESRAVTVPLDPQHLHKTDWPEAEYLYELSIEDPRTEVSVSKIGAGRLQLVEPSSELIPDDGISRCHPCLRQFEIW
jgi:hypothetical protein